ncbi:response regulator transcription factor [Cellulomonas hominis]|uniref:Response regulator transcription factor n=1 Tax=Cellulomonas hominis TaxID=156981 RepID=A0A7Z8JY68_9CELL|nr:response regulator transcription factor [Cellulomonas hominis]TKR22904.1 response regulator transcription factor [Cellulomonas hominis]
MTEDITVLLADDHHLVRSGLAGLVDAADGMRVVGQAADGAAAVALATDLAPDVILMDLSMPGTDGVEATREVLRVRPATRVVVLTSFSDHGRVSAAVAAGAVGYLLKDCEPEELVAAVRSAAQGYSPLDPRVAGALLPSAAPRPADRLSARERDVLRLLARGLANKQIGRELGIAERTVKVHVGHVFRLLGVADRTSAALWAREHLPEA